MIVLALTEPRPKLHVSDDGWLTRCGVRVAEAADDLDAVRLRECKLCRRASA